MSDPKSFLTPRQLAAKYPAFTEASIRSHIFKADERASTKGPIPGNGLAPAIFRIGRKVLIEEQKFLDWIAAFNAEGGPHE